MRKIYIVPNIVTTGNMFCGFYSMIASIHGDYISAAWAILAAAVFDMLDGRIARLAKATSQFGVEYDSLSDLVSFGVAPAILLYQWTLQPFERLGWLAAFLYLACGALRLARFNVMTGAFPKNIFKVFRFQWRRELLRLLLFLIRPLAGLKSGLVCFSRYFSFDSYVWSRKPHDQHREVSFFQGTQLALSC